PHTLDAALADEVAGLPGVERVAPQRHLRLDLPSGGHAHPADLVAFDPRRDFTVLPWVVEKTDRPFGPGDVLVGARREQPLGSELTVPGPTLTVSGKLGLTGVGPFDRSLFVSFETLEALARAAPSLDADPGRVSALLVRLGAGARAEDLRFALAAHPEVK